MRRDSTAVGEATAPPQRPASGPLHLGELRYLPASGELRLPGEEPITLPPHVGALLDALVDRAGEVVRREELYSQIWEGRHVDHEQGLNFLVRQLRLALDDDAARPRFVETVRGRGYRFIGPVVAEVPAESAEELAEGAPARGRLFNDPALAVLLMVALLAGPAQRGAEIRGSASRMGGETAGLAGDAATEAYIEGRYLEAQGTPDDLRAALVRYREALEGDPRYAAALAGIGVTDQKLAMLPSEPSSARLVAARDAAREALALDPRTPRAHRVLGIVELYLNLDPRAAADALERAIEIEPGSAEARLWHARALAAEGRFDQSVAEAQHALVLDPGSRVILLDLAWFHYFAEDYRKAITSARRALAVEPDAWAALQCLQLSYLALGEEKAARGVAGKIANLFTSSGASHGKKLGAGAISLDHPDWLHRMADFLGDSCPSLALERARLLVWAGDTSAAIAEIRVGVERRLWWSPYVLVDPAFAGLWVEPEFRQAVAAFPPSYRPQRLSFYHGGQSLGEGAPWPTGWHQSAPVSLLQETRHRIPDRVS